MYGEYTNVPSQTTATASHTDDRTTATTDFGEVISVTHNYDGTTTVVFRKHQTIGQSWDRLNEWLNRAVDRTRELVAYESRVRAIDCRVFRARAMTKPKFWPAAALAPMPASRPVQAPPLRPRPHLQHFASPKVWARRNKTTPKQPPRRET